MTTSTASRPPDWVRAAVDHEAFAHEQERLGRLWTMVGLTSDIPAEGDWFRTVLGGRSVFFQRFGDEIRGFENRCAHRFYPLRTADRGHGPILCGFHHWRYNQDGVALGIPVCVDMFGTTPREMNARLVRLDVALCGKMIFARWPRPASDGPGESLPAFLAEAAPILQTLGAAPLQVHRFSQKIAAYWKFSHHISLDDYHIVAVHPKSFGKSGYMKTDSLRYFRFGRHSTYYGVPIDDHLVETARRAAAGEYVPEHYAVYNIFPNLIIVQYRFIDPRGGSHWLISAFRYVPVAHDSTVVEAWTYAAPFQTPGGNPSPLLGAWLAPFVLPVITHFARKVMTEDIDVCAQQQQYAAAAGNEPLLGAQETRIAWFEAAYREALGDTNGGPET